MRREWGERSKRTVPRTDCVFILDEIWFLKTKTRFVNITKVRNVENRYNPIPDFICLSSLMEIRFDSHTMWFPAAVWHSVADNATISHGVYYASKYCVRQILANWFVWCYSFNNTISSANILRDIRRNKRVNMLLTMWQKIHRVFMCTFCLVVFRNVIHFIFKQTKINNAVSSAKLMYRVTSGSPRRNRVIE